MEIVLEEISLAPASVVWSTFIQPSLWWGAEVTLEPVRGGALREPWRDAQGLHHTHGTVVVFEPPGRLALTWRDEDWTFETQVTLTLAEAVGGTLIRLVHDGWEAAPVDARDGLVEAHRQGWAMHLRNLAACAEQMTERTRGEV